MSEALINYEPLYKSIIVLSSISIISLILCMFAFLCYKSLHLYSYKQVMYLFIATTLSTYSYLLYFNKTNELSTTVCQIQAFFLLWFEQSQFIWSALISYTTYKITTQSLGSDFVPPANVQKGYLYLGFIFPFANTAFAYLNGLLGESGHWCWISTLTIPGQILSWVAYSFYWAAIIFNTYYTVKLLMYVKGLNIDLKEKEIISKSLRKLYCYPVIQLIVTVPACLNKFLNFFVDSNSKSYNRVTWVFVIRTIIIVLSCSEGFLLSLAFIINMRAIGGWCTPKKADLLIDELSKVKTTGGIREEENKEEDEIGDDYN